MVHSLGYPASWSVQRSGLVEVIEQLTFGHLDRESTPFGLPDDLLAVAGNLEYHRIRGIDRIESKTSPGLPPAVLSASYRSGRPLSWAVAADGRSARLALGLAPDASGILARSLHAMVGGPPPNPIPPPISAGNGWHYGCLFGWPRRMEEAGRDPGSIIDVLLDAIQGTSLLYLVCATPENPETQSATLSGLETAIESIERSHLKLDGMADVDRTAARARDLFQNTATKMDEGQMEGLWRTSVVVGCPDRDAVVPALSILAGMLRPDAEKTTVPLRAYPCEAGGTYSVHGNLLLTSELAALCAFPQRDRSGFSIGWNTPCDVDHSDGLGVVIGEILDQHHKTGQLLRVPPIQLCRHTFVAGLTGTGKSTTVRALISSVADSSTPFLVLDPVKPATAEYAELAARVSDLCIFRVGTPPERDEIPFQFNPFAFPAGFSLSTHIDYLKATFTAAFGLFPPTPYLLETAIYRVYEARGWDLATGTYPGGIDKLSWPTLSDLLAVIDDVVDEAGYGDEITSNLRGALRTRVGNLCVGPKGLALDTRENLPDELLYDSPVVLELMGLGSQEEQAFVMGLVLTRLLEVRQTRGLPTDEALRHVVVIEEAHRLLKHARKGSQEESNMAHHAVETFVTLIAEVRAYGQGVVVTEQIPTNLTPNAVKQSSLKIVHRLTPKDDRDMVGDSMVLDAPQKRLLAILDKGRAVVHTEGMDGAVHIAIRKPAARGSVPGHSELLGRTRGHRFLPPILRARLDRVVRRRELQHVLMNDEVVAVTDALLASSIAGVAVSESLLMATIRRVAPDLTPAELSQAMDESVDDGLLRRLLYYRRSDAEYEKARSHIASGRPAMLSRLRGADLGRSGVLPWCDGCPAICRFGYEGDLLGRDPTFQQDLDHVVELPRADWRAEVDDVMWAARDRLLPGLDPFPAVLARCAGSFALRHVGVHPIRHGIILGHLRP